MGPRSFMEERGVSPKRFAPFRAHDGRGLSQTERSVREKRVDSRVTPRLAIRGGRVRQAEDSAKALARLKVP